MIEIYSNTVKSVDLKEWNAFLEGHPDSTFYHTPGFCESISSLKELDPLCLFYREAPDKEIRACIVAVIQHFYSISQGLRISRAIQFSTPLVAGETSGILKLLLSEYKRHLPKTVIYSEIRNHMEADALIDEFTAAGFTFHDHLNIYIDLSAGEEVLWDGVHSKRRNEIRKAKREGVEVKEETSGDSLDRTYPILQEVYDRVRLPLPRISYFRSLLDSAGDRTGLRIFTAILEGKAVGCMYTLCFRETIVDYYAGSYRKYYSKNPNDLIPWEVFKWGIRNGFTTFDFGGAGKPGIPYGVRDYKKKFGGTVKNPGRYLSIHRPVIYRILSKALSLRRRT